MKATVALLHDEPALIDIALSALVVAVDVIMKYCKHLKYIKNIIMITDGKGAIDWSEQDAIAQQINRENINLKV
jgi:ATP-dependent DNA helicase 2 subunit 2